MTVNTNKIVLRNDATGETATISGSSLNGNDGFALESDIQNIQAGKTSYYFDSGSARTIALPNSNQLSFGLSDTTYLITGKFKRLSGTYQYVLPISYATGYAFIRISSDTDAFRYSESDGTASSTTSINPIANNQVETTVIKRTDGFVQFYKNGIAEAPIAATKRNLSYAVISATIGNGSLSINDGGVYRVLAFNYALPADKIARYSAGAKLDYEDIGGSMTNLVPTASSDFSSDGTAYWSGVRAALTYNAGTNDMTATENSTGITNIGISRVNFLTVGKRYRIKFRAKSSNISAFGMRVNLAAASSDDPNVTDVWNPNLSTGYNNYEFYGLATATSMVILTDGTSDLDNAPTEDFTIDDIVIIQLGAILDLEPENITDATWFDASPNGLHGVAQAVANRFVPTYSSRNYIINGAFDFNQRGFSTNVWGAGGSTATPIGATRLYTADRWNVYRGSGVTGAAVCIIPLSSVDDPVAYSGITNSTRVGRLGGNTGVQAVYCVQDIESANSKQLKGKTVTLSFYYRTGPDFWGSSLIAAIVAGSGTDQTVWNGLTGAVTTSKSFAPSTTWVKTSCSVTISLTVSSVTTNQVSIYFAYIPKDATAAGNADWFEVTGVQLNEGPVAAPFERAGGSISGELALCQRYARPMIALNSSNYYSSSYLPFAKVAAGTVIGTVQFPTMRMSPTLTNVGTAIATALTSTVTSANAAITLYDAITGAALTSTGTVALTQGNTTPQAMTATVAASTISGTIGSTFCELQLGGLTNFMITAEL